MTGVQVEVGEVATPFEHRSFGDELRRCQRYFQKSWPYDDAVGTATSRGYKLFSGTGDGNSFIFGTTTFPVEMRATPTSTLYRTDGNQGGWNLARNGYSATNGGTYVVSASAATMYGDLMQVWTTTGKMFGHYTMSAEL